MSRITVDVFLWGNERNEGFHCLHGRPDKSDIKSLSEYTNTVQELIELYGWNAEENVTEELPGKNLQKFKMPSKSLIAEKYLKFLENQKDLSK